jgi:hypothetical protein
MNEFLYETPKRNLGVQRSPVYGFQIINDKKCEITIDRMPFKQIDVDPEQNIFEQIHGALEQLCAIIVADRLSR